MNENDPRHGEYAGAVAHWFDNERPCDPCARAEARYRKTRKLKHLRGIAVTLPAQGTLRRIHALMALGWSGQALADEIGVSLATMRSIGYHESKTVHAATAQKIAEGYERLCMTRPEGPYADRARSMARRKGWAPPLAWDDIDRDPDPVGIGHRPRAASDVSIASEYDHTVVERILAGDYKLTASAAEKREVVRRWKLSHNELERRVGWKVERYIDREDVA